MYYVHPEEDAAYAARTQYFLGEQMVVAPMVHSADPVTGMAAADLWIPESLPHAWGRDEGTWIDWSTEESHTGQRWVRVVGDLSRVAVFVRAGAILPLAALFTRPSPTAMASGTTDVVPKDRPILSIFAGAQGSFRLSEDDGMSEAYQDGQYEWTPITMRMERPDTLEVTILPVEGCCEEPPRERVRNPPGWHLAPRPGDGGWAGDHPLVLRRRSADDGGSRAQERQAAASHCDAVRSVACGVPLLR